VQRQYDIADAGGRAMLEVAARALDRAQDCAEQIQRDGAMVRDKNGWKDHPLLRHETANRALACRLISRLGLDVEPVKAIGRPARGPGVQWDFRRDD
jgi:Phage terminase, small subunit